MHAGVYVHVYMFIAHVHVYASVFTCLLLALPQLCVIHNVTKVSVLLMTPASVPMDTVGPHAAYQVHIYIYHCTDACMSVLGPLACIRYDSTRTV